MKKDNLLTLCMTIFKHFGLDKGTGFQRRKMGFWGFEIIFDLSVNNILVFFLPKSCSGVEVIQEKNEVNGRKLPM